MLPTPELVQSYIAAGLDCSHLEVSGDGQHFTAVIVSAAFAGKRPIQRHQLVYGTLGAAVGNEIHALALQVFTPEEFAGQGRG